MDINPRDKVLMMVEECLLDCHTALLMCLKYMSHDDINDMMRINDVKETIDED
jgi:hypothetical protein